MRIANIDGRLTIVVTTDHGIDVERASGGRFAAEPTAVFDRWDEFSEWAAGLEGIAAEVELRPDRIGAPSPTPRQIFAVGLNYRAHADESGFSIPDSPVVFTKYQSALTGPNTTVRLPPGGHTDWETELVVVVGRKASAVSEDDAWGHVAGLTIGQDLSERITQRSGPAPQFGLGKSFAGFAPTGPWIVTPDEFADPDDLGLGCSINGVEMQDGRTSSFIFGVPRLISYLSSIVTLLPGDLIFTGTPSGVGMGRDPQVWLKPGDELVTWIEGIGELRQSFTA
ncbi:MAG TPA: fumarylacetoacetate hydrolase family protein [Terrimesophilobacter sp.]|nr:fumarylacetoacetate hydrolase family protein [Terrimesophilobacter sp.]